MIAKGKLFLIMLSVLLVYSLILYKLVPKEEIEYRPGKWYVADLALYQAQAIFKGKKEKNESLDNGPCLSNALMPGWVADVVHSPRQEIDNLAENQCPAFINGEARHLVELDLEGNLVRIK